MQVHGATNHEGIDWWIVGKLVCVKRNPAPDAPATPQYPTRL